MNSNNLEDFFDQIPPYDGDKMTKEELRQQKISRLAEKNPEYLRALEKNYRSKGAPSNCGSQDIEL